jgi:release factor glutamine methyltransferase
VTIQESDQQLTAHLSAIYESSEAAAISNLVMESLTGLSKLDRIIRKHDLLGSVQESKWSHYLEELLTHKPVQYVLNRAWFAGMPFYVNEEVLIPRPETEELVNWILETSNQAKSSFKKILDIGTGSGCIPVALKKKLVHAELFSGDISETALSIASRNAQENGVAVHYIQADVLNPLDRSKFPLVDCIVSNPPYIPLKDMRSIPLNVRMFEPHLALFVPDDNPLLFYDAIAELGSINMPQGGQLFAELHESYASSVEAHWKAAGYVQIEIRNDLEGKQRMIKATWLP